MIGVAIVTHGPLAESIVAVAQHILGPLDGVRAIGLGSGDEPSFSLKRIAEGVASVDAGDGVLILVDMFGGTPCNLSLSLTTQRRVEVVSGLNLPMLIGACTGRGEASLSELAQSSATSASEGVCIATEVLRSRMK